MQKNRRSLSIPLLILCSALISAPVLAEEVQVSVKGMVCAFCAQSLKKKFSAEPAVSAVDVSLDTKLILLKLKPEPKLSDESITKTIQDAGYNVGKIKRLP